MKTITSPDELIESDLYVDLTPMIGHDVRMKCEGFNFGGSVKLRVAASMVAAAERSGRVTPRTRFVESSSGNLGIALSIVAADRGLSFTCVTDVRCNPSTRKLMRALGTDLVIVGEPDLRARMATVERLCREDPDAVWLNQYVNEANWTAHYESTAAEVAKHVPGLDVLFVGAGTSGTIMGCARYFRDNGYSVRIVGVDAVGSVIFGGTEAPRLVPGLGASVLPPLLDREVVHDVVLVSEVDTVRTCRALSRRGFLVGGSTGTVVNGALHWLDRHDPDRTLTSVLIAPDLGERYLDTIYDDPWVEEHFGAAALRPLDMTAGGRR